MLRGFEAGLADGTAEGIPTLPFLLVENLQQDVVALLHGLFAELLPQEIAHQLHL